MPSATPIRRSPPPPSAAELLARADAMAPLLRASAAEGERLGMVPPATIEAFGEAGFFDVLKPAAYGGYEYEPQLMLQIVMKVASASMADAWVLGLIMIHNWEAALADPRLAEDIWASDPAARLSSSYAPFGTAEPVEGGYIVKGRWPWSSGSDHCTWAILGVQVPDPTAPGGIARKAMFVPRSDYTVDQDSWRMAGLQGTGSKDVVVEGAFVPDYRHHDLTRAFTGDNPGLATFTSPHFRFPFGQVFGWTLASAIIGAGEGAIAAYTESMRKRAHAYSGKAMKEDPYAQRDVADATSTVHAARACLERNFAEMADDIAQGRATSPERRLFFKANASHSARQVVQAIGLIINAAGGRAFASNQPLQRFLRDAQTGANHAMMDPARNSGNYGAWALNGEIRDFVI